MQKKRHCKKIPPLLHRRLQHLACYFGLGASYFGLVKSNTGSVTSNFGLGTNNIGFFHQINSSLAACIGRDEKNPILLVTKSKIECQQSKIAFPQSIRISKKSKIARQMLYLFFSNRLFSILYFSPHCLGPERYKKITGHNCRPRIFCCWKW